MMNQSVEAASGHLLALAAGLAQQSGIRVEITDGNWSWDAQDQVLWVARSSIEQHGVDRCYGYVAHEIGHCLISRYLNFDLSSWPGAVAASILNAIEDPRVECFMARRFPGAETWIAAAYAQAGRTHLDQDALSRIPGSVLYALGCVEEFHNHWQAVDKPLPAAVAHALEHTRLARQRYAETLPATDLSADGNAALVFAQEVLPHLASPVVAPPPREMAVYVSAWHAFRIAQTDILPAAMSLHERDVCRMGRVLDQDPTLRATIESLLANPLAAHVPATHDIFRAFIGDLLARATETGPTPGSRNRFVAERLLNGLWKDDASSRPYGLPRPMASTTRCGPERAAQSAASAGGRNIALTDYEAIRAQYATAIDRLSADIEAILLPRRHPRTKSGYASGVRLDMRRAMAFEADPRQSAGLWQRTRLPDRSDLAVFLLVDLSGSMANEGKDDAAVAGSIIVLETLSRIPHVRWAGAGFQDEIIPVADFGEGLTLAVRRRVGNMKLEIHNDSPGGHNCARYNDDGPAVAAAAERLLSISCSQRLLVVVSDGGPAGRHSGDTELRQAVSAVGASGIKLVGVGLGEGTEHVREFYPHHLAGVSVTAFPQQMGSLVRELLTAGE